jgi:transposase-like protein
MRDKATEERTLDSYKKMKNKDGYSKELLSKILRSTSERKYEETVINAAEVYGVSPSSVSRHVVQMTAKKLEEFKERDLSDFKPFAVFVDTVHRGGSAFIVALGIDTQGNKKILDFWEGATENGTVCSKLLDTIERRKCVLKESIIWITDGGTGVIKTLNNRFGKNLIHQRCTIHKDRNIQRHLPKKYRKEAHIRFRNALNLKSYKDAKEELKKMEVWLRNVNESAANSLLEAFEEIITLHRLELPELLRKVLHFTNSIESSFSGVRQCEKNIQRFRNTKMLQRWLGAVFLHCEANFRKVKGYEAIKGVIEKIEKEQEENEYDKVANF